MKNFIFFIFLLISMNIYSNDLSNFSKYFEDATMRIDYFHIGDASSEIFTIDHIYKQGIWAGSRVNLLDEFNNGAYYYKLYDEASNTLIFSKGFDSYFKEYQTSQNAQEGIKRTYHESALIPFPKNKVRLSIQKRDDKNILNEIFSLVIDPQDISILKDIVSDKNVEVTKSLYNGDPHSKADVVIIAEGYTEHEKEKYQNDLQKFTQILIKQEPYKSMKESFNVYGVFKASEESGTDEPRADIYKNTTLNSTFNSLGSERYLLTEDNKTLRDLAAHVPYDAIYIMVNHERYGGGGIYNWSCTFTADNQFQEYLFIHEFGHSFAGLADEYYTSENAYTDFYKPSLEPVEPNVTALLDSNNIKWKEFLSDNIEIPTPWEKESFDEMDYAWQKLRREMNSKTAELKRNKASLELIKKAENDYAEFDKEHSIKVDKYLQSSKYYGKVGAFEGAGYLPKGLYRPMLDCIMFSKGDKPFCKVCEAAIIKVINHYSE
ncbi:MAG: peptidase M64 [Ignavibacteriales bacterium]|nr:peptidase M64 [Ignavibacteriales bacterium]